MPLRFYRRFRTGPFRLNLSKGGVSFSVGGRGAWLTFGRGRVRTTVGLPGTGLSWTEQHRLSPANRARSPAPASTLRRAIWTITVVAVAGMGLAILAALASH